MKKRLIVGLLASMMASFSAVPAMAAEVAEAKPVYVVMGEEISPFNEQTRIYFRITPAGRLQARVWSITWGRWLTDWEYV